MQRSPSNLGPSAKKIPPPCRRYPYFLPPSFVGCKGAVDIDAIMSTKSTTKSTTNGSSTSPIMSSTSKSNMTLKGDKTNEQLVAQDNTNELTANNNNVVVHQSNIIQHANTIKQRHKKIQSNPNEGHSIPFSGGSSTDNDNSYCTEIAGRSVARAALHLGLDGMEGEALDCMGSILLGYMEMVRILVYCNLY